MKLVCPTCDKAVSHESEFQPFCSERCRLIDLGEWISGNYRILDKDNQDILPDVPEQKTRH